MIWRWLKRGAAALALLATLLVLGLSWVLVFRREVLVFQPLPGVRSTPAALGLDYEELVLNRDFSDRSLRAVAAATTYPQVFVNGQLVGGADNLEKWLADARAA